MVNCSNLIIKMSPHFVLGRENVPCVSELVNRSLKADCTDFTINWERIPMTEREANQWQYNYQSTQKAKVINGPP